MSSGSEASSTGATTSPMRLSGESSSTSARSPARGVVERVEPARSRFASSAGTPGSSGAEARASGAPPRRPAVLPRTPISVVTGRAEAEKIPEARERSDRSDRGHTARDPGSPAARIASPAPVDAPTSAPRPCARATLTRASIVSGVTSPPRTFGSSGAIATNPLLRGPTRTPDRRLVDPERRHGIRVDDDRRRAAPRPGDERVDACDALVLTTLTAASKGGGENGERADHRERLASRLAGPRRSEVERDEREEREPGTRERCDEGSERHFGRLPCEVLLGAGAPESTLKPRV